MRSTEGRAKLELEGVVAMVRASPRSTLKRGTAASAASSVLPDRGGDVKVLRRSLGRQVVQRSPAETSN